LIVVPWVVRSGLKSLGRLANQAGQITASSLDTRFDLAHVPDELQPIYEKLNDLLGRLDDAFGRERRFTANVAHELRTPVAELRALSEVALRWPGDEKSAAQSFREVSTITRRMESVVTTLLALARSEAGASQATTASVDLSAEAADVWRTFADQANGRGYERNSIFLRRRVCSATRPSSAQCSPISSPTPSSIRRRLAS